MILTADSPQAERTVVLLDGRPVRSYISAEAGDEGWIEIVDIAQMAPLGVNTGNPGLSGDDEIGFTELKTKKKYGKVEFKIIK